MLRVWRLHSKALTLTIDDQGTENTEATHTVTQLYKVEVGVAAVTHPDMWC